MPQKPSQIIKKKGEKTHFFMQHASLATHKTKSRLLLINAFFRKLWVMKYTLKKNQILCYFCACLENIPVRNLRFPFRRSLFQKEKYWYYFIDLNRKLIK